MLFTHAVADTASSLSAHPPRVAFSGADARFREMATTMDLDPDAPWVGGYVDWEWEHGRHVFEAIASGLRTPIGGRRVLEFGCNVGATAIVLARLGASVTATDIRGDFVDLARLNAERFGDAVDFRHVPDSTALPFAPDRFEWIICNSVLEYIDTQTLPRVLRELDRVLVKGGIVAILGTSNRLWPREVHSRKWLVNYLPRGADRLLRRSLTRGVSAWTLRAGFAGYEDLGLSEDAILLKAKATMGLTQAKLGAAAVSAKVLRPFGISVGMLAPSMTLLLRKT